MSWRDRYVQGSFRGVPFLTEGSRTTIGQKKAIYEHPFYDGGASGFSLGRGARRWSMTACLLGTDYDVDRDKLVEAFEKPGPGLLVHPTFGSVLVEIQPEISIYEATENGGKCEISFEAIEARGATLAGPIQKPDTRAALSNRAVAVREAAASAMQRDLSLKDVRDFAASANLATLDNLITDMRDLNGTISTALAVPGRFANQIADIADQTVELISQPKELFDRLNDATALIFASVVKVGSRTADLVSPSSEDAEALDAVRAASAALSVAVTEAARLGSDPNPTVSLVSVAQRRNHAALKHNTRALVLSHIAEASAEAVYDSAQRARDVRDTLTEAIENAAMDQIAGFEPDATVQTALQDLRAATYAHLSALDLAQLAQLDLTVMESSLTLAYELYADAARADEIERLNNLEHPGFLFGRTEVLSE